MESGLHLQWPWLGLLLPLPLLVYRFWPASGGMAGQALWVPFFHQLARETTPAGTRRKPMAWGRLLVAGLIWLLLIGAGMRPQWLEKPALQPSTGRDLLLAVDLSESMLIKDFAWQGQRINRLQAIKVVAEPFIRRRTGDRLGLILFADHAYLQTPLTFDLETVATMLGEAEVGLAGKMTAIGEGIGLAVRRLRERPQQGRALILLTDGANTAGAVDPHQAARLAAAEGVRIYPIGVGSTRPMPVATLLGTRMVNPSADLDEPGLQEMARLTGGRYFRAADTAAMEEIYRELDRLEPTLSDPESFMLRSELHPWLLGPALLLTFLLAFAIARPGWRLRERWGYD
ncbi:MAG: VWA domain-containing protein [Magnetococcales bacterium]|nr:VWA domain-containing protein [Magnetococcales bacterium]